MLYFREYSSKYWKPFLSAFVFLMCEAACDLLQPTIMAKIVDVGVAGNRLDYVLRMGGLMLLITAVGAVAASGRNILSSRVSQHFGADLRSDLFTKIQTLSVENLNKFDKASLVTRLTNDVTQVQTFVNGLMRIFMKAPLLCIGSLIMAVRLNPHFCRTGCCRADREPVHYDEYEGRLPILPANAESTGQGKQQGEGVFIRCSRR